MRKHSPTLEYRAKNAAAQKKTRKGKSYDAMRVGVIDFETDPFDPHLRKHKKIEPFHCTAYYSDTEYAQFWGTTSEVLSQLFAFLQRQKPTIWYAHNGGRFDWYYFLHEIRGRILYKGGRIIRFKQWGHEFRDSFPLLPVRLEAFQKDEFDYSKMAHWKRETFRAEIERYCLSDCRYLLTVIDLAHEKFGRSPLTIGTVARKELLKTSKIGNLTEVHDAILRPFFGGGRVECLAGYGLFKGPYSCFDVNSMYPHVMAAQEHPKGQGLSYGIRREAPFISDSTVFLNLRCRSHGAFLYRDEDTHKISFPRDGLIREYNITIHEYMKALEYDQVRDITIIFTIQSSDRGNFSGFVIEKYEERGQLKTRMGELRKRGLEDTREYQEYKTRETLIKLLLNNAFGKLAQDPANFREYEIREEWPKNERHKGWRLEALIYADGYDLFVISADPTEKRYYNVGTAASITGAARAMLFELLLWAIDPIYCDTDSIICRGFRPGAPFAFDEAALGALKKEWTAAEVGIVGKKVYFASGGDLKKDVIKAKGQNRDMLTADKMRRLILKQTPCLETTSKGPKFKLSGAQEYITRELRITAPHPIEIVRAEASWRMATPYSSQRSPFIRSA